MAHPRFKSPESRRVALASGLLWLIACQAEQPTGGAPPETWVAPPPAAGRPEPPPPTAGTSPEPASAPQAEADLPYEPPTATQPALRARVWKLSHAEYARAVEDFVGVAVDTSGFEVEIDNGVYPNMSAAKLVRALLARNYHDAAERISEAVDLARLTALAGEAGLSPAAKQGFLENAIRRAFRRPPSPEDLSAYGEIFELGADTASDGSGAFRAVIRALLTSPYFLYRTEIGADPEQDTFTLTDHELASLLSFSLLGRPPDAALLRAAERGELSDPDALAAQVRALLDSPDAASTLRAFMTQWLKIHRFDEVYRDPTWFPGFDAHRAAMLAEAHDFLGARGGMTGTLVDLLTTPLTPEGALASYYASEASSGGSVGKRTGVLGLGAVVSARAKPNVTSPTLRGLFVRERLMCQEIHLPPDLPPDIVQTIHRSMPRTTRELYQMHAQNPRCASCHTLLDAVGLNFEDLDPAGRYRTLENDVPVDTSGELLGTDVAPGPTRDHSELAQRLSQSNWVRECLARQAFRFYFGQVEADRGAPPVQAARAAVTSGTFREMLVALLTTASTRERHRP